MYVPVGIEFRDSRVRKPLSLAKSTVSVPLRIGWGGVHAVRDGHPGNIHLKRDDAGEGRVGSGHEDRPGLRHWLDLHGRPPPQPGIPASEAVNASTKRQLHHFLQFVIGLPFPLNCPGGATRAQTDPLAG